MATFRCKRSGQTVTFNLQHDIDSMRGHPDYVLVDEETNEEKPLVEPDAVRTDTAFSAPVPPRKKLGRPRKEVANVGD
jgi:hypothetical protein